MAEDIVSDDFNRPAIEYFTHEHTASVMTLYNRAFGAYLMRNFGGVELLKEIFSNNKADIASFDQALRKVAGVTFEQALLKYGEAWVYTGSNFPANASVFGKSVTQTINGIEYKLNPIDYTDIYRQYPESTYWPERLGTLDLSPRTMDDYSVSVHQIPEWKNKSGTLSITLERPTDPNIVQYLLLK
jgi:hypothetical protein